MQFYSANITHLSRKSTIFHHESQKTMWILICYPDFAFIWLMCCFFVRGGVTAPPRRRGILSRRGQCCRRKICRRHRASRGSHCAQPYWELWLCNLPTSLCLSTLLPFSLCGSLCAVFFSATSQLALAWKKAEEWAKKGGKMGIKKGHQSRCPCVIHTIPF